MSRRFWLAALALLVLYGAWAQWTHRELQQPPGVLAPAAPVQGKLDQPRVLQRDGYRLEAQASYTLKARVLSREPYHLGREAELSPIDLALGWGPMSNSAVLNELSISQSGRFFHLRWHNPPPVPEAAIMRHAANTHIIPATERVADQIEAMRPGEVITLQGYLVNATATDGWHWNTSLTRSDTGAGACELFLVKQARVLKPPY